MLLQGHSQLQKVSHLKGGCMEEDIFERLGRTAGVLVGGYLFLYIMIVATQKRPVGIALLIVNATEALAKGLLYLLIFSAIAFFVIFLIEHIKTKKKQHKEHEERSERDRQSKIISLEQEKERLERQLILAEKEKQAALLALQAERTRKVGQEHHLMKRSAEEAVDEAFKHFT
jgi:hypothetical protein